MKTIVCPVSQQEIPSEQITQQLERICASRHFRQAHSLEKFLRFAVSKMLAGATEELKEYSLGVEVFQRGKQFDPRTDAVVRVQATHLRKKLASYYQEEGAADELLLDFPKGSYVPVFSRRAEEPILTGSKSLMAVAPNSPDWTDEPKQVDPSEALDPRFENMALLAGAVAPPLALPSSAAIVQPAAPPRVTSRWQIFVAFAIGILSTLALMQWLSRNSNSVSPLAPAASAQAEPAQHLLWETFFAPGATTTLAYGTPQFFQFNGFYLRDVLVNSPQEIEQAVGKRLAEVRQNFNVKLEPVEVYTGVGEAHGIYTLTRFFDQHAQELKIARSRLVGWQEVKNSNLIFLSSMRFHTLAEQLEYPNDFVIKASGIGGVIVNLHPAAGEPAEYGGQGGETYGVITLWPGKAEHRRILQLSGNTTWGTLAAAEYATDKEALRKLHEILEQCRVQHGWARHPAFFQVLVRAEVKDNQTISINYLTHHDLNLTSANDSQLEKAPSPVAPPATPQP